MLTEGSPRLIIVGPIAPFCPTCLELGGSRLISVCNRAAPFVLPGFRRLMWLLGLTFYAILCNIVGIFGVGSSARLARLTIRPFN